MRNWLEKVRNSDEAAKERWLYALTAGSTFIVVLLWLGYMSLRIPEVAPPSGAKQVAVAPKPKTASIFMAGFHAVTNDVGSRLSRGIERLKNAVGGSNVILITPEPKNFVLETVEEVPETNLP